MLICITEIPSRIVDLKINSINTSSDVVTSEGHFSEAKEIGIQLQLNSSHQSPGASLKGDKHKVTISFPQVTTTTTT